MTTVKQVSDTKNKSKTVRDEHGLAPNDWPSGRKGRGTKVKRVAPDNGPKSIDAVAAVIGLENLAKKLSASKPKPLFPNLEKKPNGVTTVKHSNGGFARNANIPSETNSFESDRSIFNSFADLLGDLEKSPEKPTDTATKLAAYIMTRSALEKVESFENIAAEATREYWKARRKLMLVNKALNSVYKSIESEEVEKLSTPSKEEINSVLKNIISNELFKEKN